MRVINKFVGPYRWLSNFWPCVVVMDGSTYPSIEAAYQAAKTLDQYHRLRFRCVTAREAKKIAKQLDLRTDWEKVKLAVMTELVRSKFKDRTLAKHLKATWPALLVEENYWGDRFWGVCHGVGNNHLGRILMKVREELIALNRNE